MKTDKQRKAVAKGLAKAKDWKQLAIDNRKKKEKKKEKEMAAMLGVMKGKQKES